MAQWIHTVQLLGSAFRNLSLMDPWYIHAFYYNSRALEGRNRRMLGMSGSQLINRVSEKLSLKREKVENDRTGHLVTYSSRSMHRHGHVHNVYIYLLATPPQKSLQT